MSQVKFTYDLSNIKSSQVGLFTKAIISMEEVVNSIEFKDALNAELALSNNLEGELSVFKVIRSAQVIVDMLSLKSFLDIDTYYTSANVYGYGYSSDDIIRINTKYTNRYNINNEQDLKALGRTLIHEISHNLGFKHDFKATSRRKNSLSYVIGRAYEEAYDMLYIPFTLERKTYCERSWKTLWLKNKCYTKTVKVYR